MGLTALLVFIVIVIVPIVILTRRNGMRSKKMLNMTWTKWFFTAYVGVLMLAGIVYAVIPSEKGQSESAVETENAYPDQEAEKFYNAIYNGRTDDIDPVFIDRTVDVEYRNDHLRIANARNERLGVEVIVEQKAEDDDKIEVTYYKPVWVVGGIDISEEMKPPEIHWSEDTLTIMNPEFIYLNYAMFKNEFPFTQFSGEGWFDSHSGGFGGGYILYLKVPNNLEVIDETGGYIYFIEK